MCTTTQKGYLNYAHKNFSVLTKHTVANPVKKMLWLGFVSGLLKLFKFFSSFYQRTQCWGGHRRCTFTCTESAMTYALTCHFPVWLAHVIWISLTHKGHCAKNELVHSHTEQCCSSSPLKWPNGTKTRQTYTTGGEPAMLGLEHSPEHRCTPKQKKGWSGSCCFLTPPATSYLHLSWCRNSICDKMP